MTIIVGLGGSLRRASFNSGLLRAAAQLAPAGSTLAVYGIAGIPLYDGDLEEAEGIPSAVAGLKDAIAAADGLLIATPEYNSSIPGVLKNAIDWLSRPNSDIARVFGGKPVALIGASPGGFGTVLSQAAWLPVLRQLGAAPWFGAPLTVARSGKLFDADGDLTDGETRERLAALLVKFVASIEQGNGAAGED
ncbi:NADPH-dependent FMN reductase [Novosphingobium sp. Gsoil 351]|uniref:NADPH-dependent FMN reductase n=1 Tax=Novosphingobium sp. Gsoil 351 TaxID=2675225 RepID=UPI0012B4775A|nr:NADPH-dependent FMN reductase [Novosphingobium sp. Gsoil 351]QGN54825.1 NAD(P)H-dependent oxidoreductase [Novosphingobium sp. Gsoil 351]